ncbi:ARS binding protein 2-domain-containing protein [Daldinia sp. FL1419]|nr:ARS binding protein 2-domain-containing protein [Daldinia sp. FL1419]
MHSMHINAFFDYLMDNPHPYWTQIPSDPNPVCEEGRDGVAAEDDMALRALLPHIRPRRGRKRPEEDSFSKSPSQRPRLESPSFNGEAKTARPDSLDPWTAHPDGRSAFMFPPVDPRSSVLPETNSAFPWGNDVPREPMSAYPQSAMTPSTRGTFWGDPAEPRSAISPSKSRSLGRRHGAKVVSSAWRSGGVSTSGRPRGRPPSSRPSDGPLSAIPDERSEFQATPFEQSTPQSSTSPAPMQPPDSMSKPAGPTSAPTVAPTTTPTTTTPTTRPSRPGRLSLQVPERASGPVRLATPPPPVVMVNGKSTVNGSASNGAGGFTASPVEDHSLFNRTASAFAGGPADDPTGLAIQLDFDNNDRTNHDEVEALLVADLLESTWHDEKGQPSPPADINETLALARAIIAGLAKRTHSSESFLIAAAALAGARHLPKLSSSRNSVHRLEVGVDYTRYSYIWELRCGPANAKFRFTETVPHARWKKGAQHRGEGADVPAEGNAAIEFWRSRYADLVHMVGGGKRREDSALVVKET